MNIKLSVLPPAQLLVWKKLQEIPANFVLYGGTAIALQLGHRQAVFGHQYDPATSLRALCSYRDGDLAELPKKVKLHLTNAAVAVEQLPIIKPVSLRITNHF